MKSFLSSVYPSGLSITLINICARGAHLVFFITIGNRFGANANTDAVLFLQAPLLVLMSVVAGTLEAVIMPSMHRAVKTHCTRGLVSFIVRRTTGFVVFLTILLMIISVLISRGADPRLVLVLLPMPLLAALSSVYMGILNAKGYYQRAVSGPVFGVIASIPLAFLLPISSINLAIIFLFFELGRFTGLWLQSRCILTEYKTIPVSKADEIFSWALKGAKYQAIGSFLVALNPFVDYVFANQLGAGAVTHVEYASRLWNLVPVLFNGPLILFYSKASRAASENKIVNKIVHLNAIKYSCYAFLLGIGAILFSRTLVNLLYGFGRMDLADRIVLSNLLSCYLIGAGPFLGGLIYVKALSAEGKISIIALVAVFSVLFNCIFNYIFVNIWGLNGIGLSTGFTYLVSMIIMGYCFEKIKFISANKGVR